MLLVNFFSLFVVLLNRELLIHEGELGHQIDFLSKKKLGQGVTTAHLIIFFAFNFDIFLLIAGRTLIKNHKIQRLCIR